MHTLFTHCHTTGITHTHHTHSSHHFIRHEMPTDPNDPLSNQKLKDRYYGVNDPVADKLMKQASDMPKLVMPDDKSITSLYVGGVNEGITEKDLRYNYCVCLCVSIYLFLFHSTEIISISLVRSVASMLCLNRGVHSSLTPREQLQRKLPMAHLTS